MTIVPAGEFTTEPATAMRAAAQIPISYSSTFADWERLWLGSATGHYGVRLTLRGIRLRGHLPDAAP
jgi:hypothetical protein